MADAPHHPVDALQDAIDGRLDADQRAALDAHLAACSRCRREYEALRWTKTQLAGAARAIEVPAGLEARLRSVLDAEDRSQQERSVSASAGDATKRRSHVWVRWVAAAAAIVAVVWVGSRLRQPPPPADAAASFRAFASSDLALDVESGDVRALESWLRASGLPFSARVFDFGMMDYRLAGGGLHRVAGQTSALFAYRASGDRALVCQMYEGRIDALPPPTDRRTNDGIEFLVYREGELTVVFWQEGPVVCVLAANGDPEAAIRLAFAKAVRV